MFICFPARENHVNTKGKAGHTEQKLNQPTYWTVDTGVNYLLTINHHYYYPTAAAAVAPAVEQVSGMVIIIIMTQCGHI